MVVYFLKEFNGLENVFQNRVFRTRDSFVACLNNWLGADYYFGFARNTFQKYRESSFQTSCSYRVMNHIVVWWFQTR